jgi:hypothetical protein
MPKNCSSPRRSAALAQLAVSGVGRVEDVDDLPREVAREHLEGDVGLGHLVVLVAHDALAHVAGAAEGVDALDEGPRRQQHLEAAAFVAGLARTSP